MSSDPTIRHPIEELAEQFLECYRRGERPDVGEFARQYPERADEISDLFAALVLMEEAGNQDQSSDDGTPLDEAPGPPVQRLGHYRILREVGRGGMGIVYEAVQEKLGRFVALKVLPPELAEKPIYRARFEREAQSAARLHHTNIVPVFDVGEQDGTPYFAMQFIAGRVLDSVLADLRQQRKTTPTPEATPLDGTAGTPQYYRSMARIGLQVADALVHAHEQGVVHRDIKPSNILLDEKGKAWISDFGLAKDEWGDPTRSGDLVGTLRYMAPERFDGHSYPSSDIYALGITLYEMLTLQPPFAILDRAQLVQQILKEEPARPTEWDRGIPRDLETIVLKAIAKEPSQRYDTAKALAEDLSRFLADRPILARRSTVFEQVRRWVRRNPVVAGLSAAVAGLLLGLTGLFLAAYLREQGLNRKLKIAKNDSDIRKTEAERQRDRARKHADRSLAVIDRMLTRVGDTDLAHVPYMDKARRRLLEDALEFYTGFQRDESDDPDARREVGRAHGRVARIQNLLGQREAAEDSWGQAISIQQALVGEFPNEPRYRLDLAFSERNQAVLKHITGHSDDAVRTLRRLDDDLARLAKEHSELLEARVEQFETQFHLGVVLHESRKPDEAKAAYVAALELADALAHDEPGNPDRQLARAQCLTKIGWLAREGSVSGHLIEAEKHYLAALEILKNLVAEHAEDPGYQSALAVALNNLGLILSAQGGRQAEAAEALERSQVIHVQLAAEHPDVVGHKMNAAREYNNLGLFYRRGNNLEKAIEANQKALKIHDELRQLDRGNHGFAINYAGTCGNQANYLHDQKKYQESLEWYGKVFDLLADIPEAAEHETYARSVLHDAHTGRAGAYLNLNRPEDAAKDYRRVVELSEGEKQFRYVYILPRALAYLGEHARAAQAIESLLASGPQSSPTYKEMASDYGLCLKALDHDIVIAAADRVKLTEQYGSRAVALLAKAGDMSFFETPAEVAALRKEEKLQPLQDREDFQKLLNALEEKVKSAPKK